MSHFHIISRSLAKLIGIKFFYTGKNCQNGVSWLRRVSTGNCVCSKCRSSKNKGNNKWYQSVKDSPKFKESIREKAKPNKDKKREYDRLYRERTAEKQAQWNREWSLKNKEKVKAIKHNYKARRKAVEDSGISSKELAKWAASKEKSCYWCKIDCKENYHIDHYEPLSKGGKHELENLVIACPSCNIRKNAKDPYEFAQKVAGRLF